VGFFFRFSSRSNARAAARVGSSSDATNRNSSPRRRVVCV
jgi:hypothetical protein